MTPTAQADDAKGMTDPNNCAACDHKRYPDGGHCYMFRHAPEWECQQHTARRPFTMSLFEVARMAAALHPDGGNPR
jgi:hypothetical protein